MTTSHQPTARLLLSGQVLEAISSIRARINGSGYLYTQELDELEGLYRQAISYRVQGVIDPEYPRIYQRIVSRVLHLARTLELDEELSHSYHLYHSHYRQYWLSSNAPDLSTMLEQLQHNECRAAYDKQMLQLFAKVWSARELTEIEARDLLSYCGDSYLCCVITSALTLSLQEYWSEQKFLTLLRLLDHPSLQVRVRVVVGLVLCIQANASAISLSSDTLSLVWEGTLQEYPLLEEYLREAALGIYRVQGAEELGHKVQRDLTRSWEGLSPEVRQRMTRLGNKTRLDQRDSQDERPEWLEELRQSDMAEQILQFGRLQDGGMDIMFGSFAGLKQHSFFKEVMHWFIPLELRHSALSRLSGIERLRPESLASIGVSLCDNDSYSLLLTLSSMPDEMRATVLESLSQIPSSDPSVGDSPLIFSQEMKSYVEGLYRFYKLFERKVEFKNIFSYTLPLEGLPLLSTAFAEPAFLHRIGDVLIQQKRYTDAVATYKLLGSLAPLDSLTYEKLGWSHIQLGQWQEALEAYQRADLIIGDNPRLYRQMAECAYQLHLYAEAIQYYEECNRLSDEETASGALLLSQANCYIALGEFASALSLGYRYELTRQPSLPSMRIIAYCLFVQGLYAEAQEYYHRISNAQGYTGTDLFQYAHTLLMLGHYNNALELYRKSHSMLGGDRMLELWHEDKTLLFGLGLDADYFQAMSEYLQML